MVDCNHANTKKDAVVISVGSCKVFIWKDTILTGLISVRNGDGKVLWQKTNCTALDLPFAIEVASRGIQTDVFETK